MDDTSQNIIRSWMITAWSSGTYANFVDLHVDDVDPRLENPSIWLKGGLKCLLTAISLRDALRVPLLVALAFSLKSRATPTGLNFKDLRQLEGQFDHSPPSLYLLPLDHFTQNEDWITEISAPQIDFGIERVRNFYVEYPSTSDPDYSRALWLSSSPS